MKKSSIICSPLYFESYIQQAPDVEIVEALKDSLDIRTFIPQSQLEASRNYAYAPGKWTVAEVLQHITDTERVFAYRALRFARNDATELPGFDENLFVENAPVAHLSIEQLLEEYSTVRQATILLYSGLTDEALLRKGVSNKNSIDVLALGFTIAGHAVHHVKILNELYFNNLIIQ